jgi:hypothetical protein
MKTFIKTFAFAAFAVFATACSSEAERLSPDTLSAKKAVEAPSTGREDMPTSNNYAVSETFYYNADASPETRDYFVEVDIDATRPEVLTITGLAENMELQVEATTQDGTSFTFAHSFGYVEGFEGPVQISGAGSFSNKSIRIAYSLQSVAGEMQAEVAGDQQDY